jgi:hypothetical protein
MRCGFSFTVCRQLQEGSMRLMRQVFIMSALLISAVAILTVVSLHRLPAAPGGAPATTRSGDVNCDGELDIADPVHLLNFLFLGGKEPCAVAQDGNCCPALEAKLDRIIAALEDPCRDSSRRLVDNGDRTVTDLCTGLVWQTSLHMVDVDLDGIADTTFNYPQARSVAAANREGGFADWRLPTVRELESLVHLAVEKRLFVSRLPELDISFIDQGPNYWTATETRLPPGVQGETQVFHLVTRPDSLGQPIGFFPNSKTEKARVLLVRGPVE